jgi:hypothetical protein
MRSTSATLTLPCGFVVAETVIPFVERGVHDSSDVARGIHDIADRVSGCRSAAEPDQVCLASRSRKWRPTSTIGDRPS